MANAVKSIWKVIDAWLGKHLPKELIHSPGLKASEIRKAEETFGHRLPDDVRESYLIHNGLPALEVIPGYNQNIGHFQPLIRPKKCIAPDNNRNAVETWRSFKELVQSGRMHSMEARPRGPISKVFWSTDWIPLFDNIQGDYLFLDLNPPKRGVFGQIIDWERLDGPRRVFAESFQALLQQIADDLAHDRYRVEVGGCWASLIKKSVWKRMRSDEQKAARTPEETAESQPARQALADYFRTILDKPHMLRRRSENERRDRWLKDHRGEEELPDWVDNSLRDL
jgi:cell wall assembly regulator SMI1